MKGSERRHCQLERRSGVSWRARYEDGEEVRLSWREADTTSLIDPLAALDDYAQ
jgi:hypothetical protein